MAAKEPSTTKRTARLKKPAQILSENTVSDLSSNFTDLIKIIGQSQSQFYKLQEEIENVRKDWLKEQEEHQKELEERDKRDVEERKRQEEIFEYEFSRKHRKAEDEFNDQKTAWEKHLKDQKELIENERKELDQLRKLAANFDNEKTKAIKEAQTALEKELLQQFENEKKLKEQETKTEKEILNLRISALASENSRQANEILALKKALDISTAQLKDVAIKVIESRTNTPANTSLAE